MVCRYVRTYPSAKAEPTGGPAFITWQERTGTEDPEAAMQVLVLILLRTQGLSGWLSIPAPRALGP